MKQQELSEYQQKRFGPQGDFLLQKQQLIQPVQDQVFDEIQKIGNQKKYDLLVDSSEAALLYSADRHDLSDQVLRAIGRTGKRKAAEDRQAEKDNDKDEPYLSVIEAEKKEEKEQAKEDRKEEIQKAISERDAARNEQKRQRDSVKAAKAAAYKERRDKMMADRKRKRDSIQAVRAAARAKKQAEIDARKAKKEEDNKKTPSGGE